MVEPRGMSQAILPGDLREEMQGGTDLAPAGSRALANSFPFLRLPFSYHAEREVVRVFCDRPGRIWAIDLSAPVSPEVECAHPGH